MADHLFLGLDDRRLYIVGQHLLSGTVVLAGNIADLGGMMQILDLKTDIILAIPSGILQDCVVPDAKIFDVLNKYKISGLRPAGYSSIESDHLPMSGNFVNPSWISILLHGACDSRCKFCFTDSIRKDPGLTTSQVLAALDYGRASGIEDVVFTGGEPTLRADLLVFIEYARRIGYKQIQIQTNGHRLSDPSYVRTLVSSGLSSALVSLHGSSASLHDRIAGSKNSYFKVMTALRNLRDSDLPFTANFVVCADNGASSSEMVEIIGANFPNGSLRFSNMIIEGAAYSALRRNIPSLCSFVDWVSAAIARGKELGVAIEVENVPPCASRRLGLAESYTLSNRQQLLQVSPFYTGGKSRGEFDVKLSACSRCGMIGNCGGLQMAYLSNVPIRDEHVWPI